MGRGRAWQGGLGEDGELAAAIALPNGFLRRWVFRTHLRNLTPATEPPCRARTNPSTARGPQSPPPATPVHPQLRALPPRCRDTAVPAQSGCLARDRKGFGRGRRGAGAQHHRCHTYGHGKLGFEAGEGIGRPISRGRAVLWPGEFRQHLLLQ